jgi:hypothetical protein
MKVISNRKSDYFVLQMQSVICHCAYRVIEFNRIYIWSNKKIDPEALPPPGHLVLRLLPGPG